MPRMSLTMNPGTPRQWQDVEIIIGHNRIFRQGTDDRLFVDFVEQDSALAKLKMQQLNKIPGVMAKWL